MKTTQLLGFLTVIAIIGVHADLHIGCQRLCGFPFLSSSKCSVCCYRMGYSIGQCVTGQCLCSFPKHFKYEPPIGTPILMETKSNEPIKVKIADQNDSGTKDIKTENVIDLDPEKSNKQSNGHKTDLFDVKTDFQLPKESLESIWESTQDNKKPMTDLFVDKSSISKYNHRNERQDNSKNNNNVSYSASLESNKKDNENTLSDEVLLAAATSSKLKEIPLELIDDAPPKVNDPIDFNPSAASALLAGRTILEGRDIITGLDIRASRRMEDESTNDLIPTREFLAPPISVTAKRNPESRVRQNDMRPGVRGSPDIRSSFNAVRAGAGGMRLGTAPLPKPVGMIIVRGTGDMRPVAAPGAQSAIRFMEDEMKDNIIAALHRFEPMEVRTGTGDVRLGTAPVTQAAMFGMEAELQRFKPMAVRTGTGDVRLGTAPVTQAGQIMAVRTGTGDVRLGTAPVTQAAILEMADELRHNEEELQGLRAMAVRTGTGDVRLGIAPVTQAAVLMHSLPSELLPATRTAVMSDENLFMFR